MGVKGLWRLMLPIGRRISIETLEGQILAVDASIWLTQFLKAMRDSESGQITPGAHLVGFFRRLCKLRYQGIRPILVFDGVTPEIKLRELQTRRKRREQFSKLEGDSAVQRMAKRILTQQLKMKKQRLVGTTSSNSVESRKKDETKEEGGGAATATSSSAPGFYIPELGHEQQKSKNPTATNQDEGQKESSGSMKKAAVMEAASRPQTDRNAENPSNSDGDEEVIQIMEEDVDYFPESVSNGQSDWDAIVIKDNGSEKKDDKHNSEKAGKKRTLQQLTKRKRPSTRGGQSSFETEITSSDNDFDVDYVASLPSTERKDWVEDAQRKRRMSSRREFMQVAYDPEGLSKCQLQNFLKSTKLNQAIHAMARKTVQDDGLEGTAAAGDRSRRIIFEKDDDDTGFADPKKKMDQDRAAMIQSYKQKHQKRKGKRVKISVMSSSEEEDSDDEVEWGNGGFTTSVATLSKSRAIVDDETDSENENDDATAGGFFKSGEDKSVGKDSGFEAAASPVKVNAATVDEQVIFGGGFFKNGEGLKDSEGGGFLPADTSETAEASRNSKPDLSMMAQLGERKAQELQDEALARALQTVEDGESVGSFEEGGGFVRQVNGVISIVETAARPGDSRSKSYEIDGEDDQKPPSKDDAVVAQEIQDEQLAQALQNSEFAKDDDRAGADTIETRNLVSNHLNLQNNQHLDGQMAMFPINVDASDSEKDNTGGGFFANKDDVDIPDPLKHDACRDKKAGTEGKNGEIRHTSSSSQHPSSDEEDESIDWEDGEDGVDVVALSRGETRWEGELPHTEESARKQSENGRSHDRKYATKELNPVQRASTWKISEGSHGALAENMDETAGGGDDGIVNREGEQESLDIEKPIKSPSKALFHHSHLSMEKPMTEEDHVIDEQELTENKDEIDPWAGDGDFSPSKKQDAKSEDMAAALEHAQATAANLTNWAGRAFRRAIAQHAEENGVLLPDAAKPKVLNADIRKDASAAMGARDSSDGTARETKPASPPKVAASSTEHPRKDSGSKPVEVWPEAIQEDSSSAVLESPEEYQEQWAAERNQQERDMDTVTDEMKTEVMQLLQLFGVPYMEAPAEAEAQCVELESLGLVDGVVTEDSDVFVFGGQRIYKNIFDDQKYVEVYHAKDAEREMNLTKDGLVALAMLLGGDYTEGVRGVGIVNGMEILQAFDVSQNLHSGLEKFREWLDGFDPTDVVPVQKGGKSRDETSKVRIFHRKHHTARTRWIAPMHFPDPKVLNAYCHPVVDTASDRFSWGVPDLDRLLLFIGRHVGWPAEETRRLVEPVIQKVEGGGMRQTRLDAFMRYEDGIKFADVRSKRLREVLQKVQQKQKEEPSTQAETTSKFFED